MKTSLNENENLIKEGAANLQRGLETVGGKLYVTNHRLLFEPHAINIQSENMEINIVDIKSTEKSWTKFLNIIPIFPNSLLIHTKDGQSKNFVLFGREQWKHKIDELI